ncbi:MAG: hypothetical protein ACKO92_05790 [Actinomycetota bacterium]
MTSKLLTNARGAFADRNPNSRKCYDEARRYLHDGHTRTVVTLAPEQLQRR